MHSLEAASAQLLNVRGVEGAQESVDQDDLEVRPRADWRLPCP